MSSKSRPPAKAKAAAGAKPKAASAATSEVTNVPYNSEAFKHSAGLEYAGFVIDLFLDEQREVRLTQVLYVKKDEGEAWNGWDAERLLNFFARQAGVKLGPDQAPAGQPVLPASPPAAELQEIISANEADAVPPPPEPPPPGQGRLQQKIAALLAAEQAETPAIAVAPVAAPTFKRARLRQKLAAFLPPATLPPAPVAEQADALPLIELSELAEEAAPTVLASGQAFQVRLASAPDAFAQGDVSCTYSATIFAKRWEDNARLLLGQGQGTLHNSQAAVVVPVPEQVLPPGLYRLQAALLLTPAKSGAPAALATRKGGLLQIR